MPPRKRESKRQLGRIARISKIRGLALSNQARERRAARSIRKEKRFLFPRNTVRRLRAANCPEMRRVFRNKTSMTRKVSRSWWKKGKIWKEGWCKDWKMRRLP